jgi:hypothetical protein
VVLLFMILSGLPLQKNNVIQSKQYQRWSLILSIIANFSAILAGTSLNNVIRIDRFTVEEHPHCYKQVSHV